MNDRSVVAYSGGDVGSVSWSGDGRYIGVTGDDDTVKLYHASNLTDIHGQFQQMLEVVISLTTSTYQKTEAWLLLQLAEADGAALVGS